LSALQNNFVSSAYKNITDVIKSGISLM